MYTYRPPNEHQNQRNLISYIFVTSMTDLDAFPAAGGSCSLSLHFLLAFPDKLKCIVRYELTQQLQKVITGLSICCIDT